MLYSAVYYPANYGFIPRSFCDDSDPLDATASTLKGVSGFTLQSTSR
jgi:inorganic pyrophosphatase